MKNILKEKISYKRYILSIYNRSNSKLLIRFAKTDKKKIRYVSPCINKKKIAFGSRYNKLGFFEIEKNNRKKVGKLGLYGKKNKRCYISNNKHKFKKVLLKKKRMIRNSTEKRPHLYFNKGRLSGRILCVNFNKFTMSFKVSDYVKTAKFLLRKWY